MARSGRRGRAARAAHAAGDGAHAGDGAGDAEHADGADAAEHAAEDVGTAEHAAEGAGDAEHAAEDAGDAEHATEVRADAAEHAAEGAHSAERAVGGGEEPSPPNASAAPVAECCEREHEHSHAHEHAHAHAHEHSHAHGAAAEHDKRGGKQEEQPRAEQEGAEAAAEEEEPSSGGGFWGWARGALSKATTTAKQLGGSVVRHLQEDEKTAPSPSASPAAPQARPAASSASAAEGDADAAGAAAPSAAGELGSNVRGFFDGLWRKAAEIDLQSAAAKGVSKAKEISHKVSDRASASIHKAQHVLEEHHVVDRGRDLGSSVASRGIGFLESMGKTAMRAFVATRMFPQRPRKRSDSGSEAAAAHDGGEHGDASSFDHHFRKHGGPAFFSRIEAASAAASKTVYTRLAAVPADKQSIVEARVKSIQTVLHIADAMDPYSEYNVIAQELASSYHTERDAFSKALLESNAVLRLFKAETSSLSLDDPSSYGPAAEMIKRSYHTAFDTLARLVAAALEMLVVVLELCTDLARIGVHNPAQSMRFASFTRRLCLSMRGEMERFCQEAVGCFDPLGVFVRGKEESPEQVELLQLIGMFSASVHLEAATCASYVSDASLMLAPVFKDVLARTLSDGAPASSGAAPAGTPPRTPGE